MASAGEDRLIRARHLHAPGMLGLDLERPGLGRDQRHRPRPLPRERPDADNCQQRRA
jgi:hypothetical protein